MQDPATGFFNVNKRLDITGLKPVFQANVPWKTVFVFCTGIHETVRVLLGLVNINALKFFKGCLIKVLLVSPGCIEFRVKLSWVIFFRALCR